MALIKRIILTLLFLFITTTVASNIAVAREPGVGPAFPAGLTLGIPTGAIPPPGFYVTQRFNYSDGEVVDNNGDGTGTDVTAWVESTQLNWSTEWEPLGARYLTFLSIPVMMDIDVSGAPAGNGSNSGLLNPIWKHLLSWDLGSGWFTSVGVGYYFMIGDDDQGPDEPTVAPPFDYILEPEVAVSYLSKDWHITAQAVFNINGENDETDYESGDQIFLNLAATRIVNRWSFGGLAYYQDQINNDKNKGLAYGGVAQEDAKALAVGALVGYNFGPVSLNTYFTQNIYTRNTTDEFNAWLRLDFRLPI